MTARIGLIGAGVIGHVHLKASQAIGCPIVAVADVDGKAAKKTADEFNLKHAFSDPQQMLDFEDVDAVIVAVPNRFHASLTTAALQAGKDVLCEKPMALTVEQCREMNAVAAKQKRMLQIGFIHRFSAVANTARQFIEAGRLGNIYHVKCNNYRRRGIPGLGGWFTTRALSGGGPLIDLGVHILDLTMHLMHFPQVKRLSGKVYSNFGSPIENYRYESMWSGPPIKNGTFDVEDSAHAFIRLEGGCTLEMNTTWAGNFPDDSVHDIIGFFGDKGGLTFQLGGNSVKIATEEENHNVDITPRIVKCEQFQDQLRTFIEAIQTRKITKAATGEEGRIIQSMVEDIYRSSEADAEVEFCK